MASFNILFVNPPSRDGRPDPIVVPPLGLAYLAAVARRAGFAVSILDAFAEGLSWSAFAGRVGQQKWDVIGLTGMTPVFDTVRRAIGICRPFARHLLLGGPHATAFQDTVLQDNPALDFAVVGEGEDTIRDLLEALQAGSRDCPTIPGVATRDGPLTRRRLIRNLDDLPFPARDLLPNERYRYPLCPNRRVSTVITSRGCPYQCIFCDKGTFGSRWRARSAGNVLAEIDELVHDFSTQYVIFYDDIFTLNTDRLCEICEGLIRRRYPLAWKAEGRVDLVDARVLALMRRAGCDLLAYGVESANPVGLEFLGKRTTPEAAREAFRKTREAGIRTMGYFILGIPGETYDDALRTIRFAVDVKTDYAQFSVLSPLPGTRLYDLAREKGWYREIAAQNVSDKDEKRPVVLSDNWTEEKLISIVREAHRRFYLRPTYMLKKLLALRAPSEFRSLARLGLGMIGYALGRRR